MNKEIKAGASVSRIQNMFTEIFVAHFLGWSQTQHDMIAPKGRGPTRTLQLDFKSGPSPVQIPVSLVSAVTNPDAQKSVSRNLSAHAEEAMDQIWEMVARTNGQSNLIYIAFGSQGSNFFSGESYQKIIDYAAAVKGAIVLFTLPRNAPAEWLNLTKKPTSCAPKHEHGKDGGPLGRELAYWERGPVLGSSSQCQRTSVSVRCI